MAATRGYPGYSRSSQARASFQARTSTASRVAASAGSSPSYPAGPPRSDQIEQRSAHCATHNSVTRKTSNSSRFSQVSSTTWFGSSVISGSWAMDLSVGGAWQLPPTTTPTIIVLPTRHRRALPNHGRKILPPTVGVDGELAWRVPSLAVPDPHGAQSLAELGQNPAVQLFVERAMAAQPRFGLTMRNAPAVVQICRRLDGIPLALELAAARVEALTAEQLAVRLDQRFRLLTGGSRAALPRQQTLAATLDWSYGLLTRPERRLFERLAVFAGGWSLEEAEAVCADDGLDPEDVLDLLVRLVRKSR